MSGCSVIMVSYHTGAVLFHAIERVLAQQGLAELIVVDNGNPPEVVARLHSLPVRLTSGHGNVGFAAGCNLGVRQATAEYILLLNPDSLLEKDALAHFTAALEANPGAMMAGGLLLNPDGSEQRGGRRELLTPQTAISEAFFLHRLIKVRRLNNNETPTPETICEVPAISGACMFLKRDDYLKLGGMDEGYFLHVEDMDLCWRVHTSGGKILFVPEARVVHLLSTSDASKPFIEWCKARGFMRYFHKHFATRLSWLADCAILARFAVKLAFPRRPAKQAAIAGKKLLLLLLACTQPPRHDLRGNTIIVTGATSPLGMLLMGHVLAAGAQVIAVSRKAGFPLDMEGITWQQADINLPGLALPDAGMAIHCAPLWALPLEAMAKAGVKRLVAFGSTSLFGKEASANASEQRVVLRLREAEARIAERSGPLGIACTILRPTMIYGTGLDGNISRIARTVRRFRCFPIVPPACGLRQPVHADDLAGAAIDAMLCSAAAGKAYNVSGGETLSYRAMVERVFRVMGKRPRLVPLPWLPLVLDAAGRMLQNTHVNADIARRMNIDLAFPHDDATRDFGYAPRGFLSGGTTDLEGLR